MQTHRKLVYHRFACASYTCTSYISHFFVFHFFYLFASANGMEQIFRISVTFWSLRWLNSTRNFNALGVVIARAAHDTHSKRSKTDPKQTKNKMKETKEKRKFQYVPSVLRWNEFICICIRVCSLCTVHNIHQVLHDELDK